MARTDRGANHAQARPVITRLSLFGVECAIGREGGTLCRATRCLLSVLLIGLLAVFVSPSLARSDLELSGLLQLQAQLDAGEAGTGCVSVRPSTWSRLIPPDTADRMLSAGCRYHALRSSTERIDVQDLRPSVFTAFPSRGRPA